MQDHRTLAPSLYRPTVEQWFSNPYVQTLATSKDLGWNNVIVRTISLSPIFDFSPTPDTKDDTLVLMLEGSVCVEGHGGERFFKRHLVKGALTTYPYRCDQFDSRWDSSATVLFLELSRRSVEELASSTLRVDPAHIEILVQIGFYDPLLRYLATGLYHELQNQSLFGPLFAESVTNTIILHLLRDYSNVSTTPHIRGGTLTSPQVRIVEEYVQAHLHQKISLADLANCLHMSVPHFEKMFRATLDCPPYRYVLERKIERAKLLMRTTRLSLYEVARDCGFANQSHFTRHFTRFVGISPARFMRGIR